MLYGLSDLRFYIGKINVYITQNFSLESSTIVTQLGFRVEGRYTDCSGILFFFVHGTKRLAADHWEIVQPPKFLRILIQNVHSLLSLRSTLYIPSGI